MVNVAKFRKYYEDTWGPLHFKLTQSGNKWKNFQSIVSYDIGYRKGGSEPRSIVLKVRYSSQNIQASALESESVPTPGAEATLLKDKAEDVGPFLDGRCIYLVGMMGSGKTTVGRILSEALNYSFCDCDTLIEQVVGRTTVAEIFNLHGESFFLEKMRLRC